MVCRVILNGVECNRIEILPEQMARYAELTGAVLLPLEEESHDEAE